MRPIGVKRVLLVLVALVAALVVVPSSAAWACSCAQPIPAQNVQHVDVVLRGTVIDRQDPGRLGRLVSSSRPVTYEIAVAEVYKGRAAGTAYVTSAADGASCGLEVSPGREYVFFLRADGTQLRGELCDGTAEAGRDLVAQVEDAAGPGQPPSAGSSGEASDTAWLAPLVGGTALAVLLGAGLVLVLALGRRRR